MRLQTDHWVGYTRQVFPSVSNFETGALLVGLQDLELMLWEVSPLFLITKQMSLCWSGLVGGLGPVGCRAAWGMSCARRLRSHHEDEPSGLTW